MSSTSEVPPRTWLSMAGTAGRSRLMTSAPRRRQDEQGPEAAGHFEPDRRWTDCGLMRLDPRSFSSRVRAYMPAS